METNEFDEKDLEAYKIVQQQKKARFQRTLTTIITGTILAFSTIPLEPRELATLVTAVLKRYNMSDRGMTTCLSGNSDYVV